MPESVEPFIGTDAQAPAWMLRPFIMRGYRIGFVTNRQIFRSLFMWHNETTNSWSHIFGALLFVWLLSYVVFYMSVPVMPALTQGQCQEFFMNETSTLDEHFDSAGSPKNHP